MIQIRTGAAMKLTLHLALRSRVAKSWPLANPVKARNEDRAKARPTATRFDQDRRELFPVTPDVMLARPAGADQADRDRAAYAARSGRSPGSVSARSPGLRTARRLARRPAGKAASQPTARRPGSGSRRPANGRARVNCCSPACRGRRGGRGPELGIGISKPAPAMRAATAAAPASPIGQMW